MKVGDLVRFPDCGETGFVVDVIQHYVIVMWSTLWDRSWEQQSQLEVISESR